MIARSNVGMYFTVLVCECAKCGAFGVTISHIARQFWAQKKIDKRPRLMPKIIKEGTNVEQSKNYCLYLKPKVRLIRIEMWFCTNSAKEVLTIFGWYREPGWIRWLFVSVCVCDESKWTAIRIWAWHKSRMNVLLSSYFCCSASSSSLLGCSVFAVQLCVMYEKHRLHESGIRAEINGSGARNRWRMKESTFRRHESLSVCVRVSVSERSTRQP